VVAPVWGNGKLELFAAALVALVIFVSPVLKRLSLNPISAGLVSRNSFQIAWIYITAFLAIAWAILVTTASDLLAGLMNRPRVRIGRAEQGDTTVFVYDTRGRLLFTTFAGSGPTEGVKWWTPRIVSVASGNSTRLYNARGHVVSCASGNLVRYRRRRSRPV
jgi:hypothetical protein